MKRKKETVWQRLNKEAQRNPLVVLMAHDALLKQVGTILADEDMTRATLAKSFVNPEAWIGTAKEVRKILDMK